MAAEGKQKQQVPKVFSERAKQAAMQAQVAQDLLEARTKATFGLKKAQLKAQSNMATFVGGQLDAAAQAKVDQQAQGQQEPVGPPVNVAPLPDASQPGNSMQGATGLDLNALLTQPGAVNGGAGIQAATGGMGRSLEGQVSPTISQQNTVSRNVPMEVNGEITNVPQHSTETQVTENKLTPYQLGSLQAQEAGNNVAIYRARLISNDKIKDSLATDLAGTYLGLQMGVVDQDTVMAAMDGITTSLATNGMTPADLADVRSRALARAGRMGTEAETKWKNSAPELLKLQEARRKYHLGDQELSEIAGRIQKLQTGEFEGLSKTIWDMYWKPTVVKAHKEQQHLVENMSLLDNLAGMVDKYPTMFGAAGTLSRTAIKGTGALRSIASMFGGDEAIRQVITYGRDSLEQMREHQMANGTFTGENITKYAELKQSMEQAISGPELLGTVETLENAFGLSMAADNLDKTTVAGFDSFKKRFVNLTGAKDSSQVRAQLQVLQNIYKAKKGNADTFWRYQGQTPPEYVPVIGPLLEGTDKPKPYTATRPPAGIPFSPY